MQPLSGYVLSVFIIEYADRGKVHRHYPLTSGIIFLMTSRYHVDPHDRSLDIVFLCLLVFLSAPPPPAPFRPLGFPFSRQNWRKRRVMSISALVLWYFFWGEKENKIDPPLGSKETGERKLSVLRQIRIGSWYELNVFSNVHRIEEKSTLVRKSSADSLVYFEHKPETECLRLLNLDRLTLNRVHLFSAKLRESLHSWKTISAVTGFCFWGIRIKKQSRGLKLWLFVVGTGLLTSIKLSEILFSRFFQGVLLFTLVRGICGKEKISWKVNRILWSKNYNWISYNWILPIFSIFVPQIIEVYIWKGKSSR